MAERKKKVKPIPDVECLKYHGTKSKPDIKIFVSHRIDLDSETIDNPLYIPVRCGAVYDKRKGITMLGDDTGDNISEKRNSFCELTVQYWAWKNIKADYYGLCHYRRYLSFAEEKFEKDPYGNVLNSYLTAKQISKYHLIDKKNILDALKNNPVIVADGADVSKFPEKFDNLNQHYDKASPAMHGFNMDKALEVIKEKYNDIYPYAQKYMSESLLYPCNMFIMRRDIFFEYSSFLFDVLFEVEKQIDTTNFSVAEYREIGMIGERLLGIYIEYLKDKKNINYATKELTIFFNTNKQEEIFPFYKTNNIPLVFSMSDFYVPYAAVTIYSLLKNRNQNKNYDIIILTNDIQKRNEDRLKQMISQFKNTHLRVVNVGYYMNDYVLNSNSSFISTDTFSRLLATTIFKNYSKVIYIDSDMLVIDDISKLLDIKIGNNLLAATSEPIIYGMYKIDKKGVGNYLDNKLKLKDPFKYFQAGLIIFNIDEMKKRFKNTELLDFAQKNNFMYADQDVLNVKCKDRVYYLNQKWNVTTDWNYTRIRDIVSNAPKELYEIYIEARKNPSIIHYAGSEKPWNIPFSDWAIEWWEYAKETHFYEMILSRMIDSRNSWWIQQTTILMQKNGLLPRPQSRARDIADKLLPKGSKRREFIKMLCPKDSIQWKFFKKIYRMFDKK